MDEKIKSEFQKLLAYQKKDIELRKLFTLLNRDEALITKNKQKKAFDDAKLAIAECEQQAGTIMSSYSELVKYVQANEELLNELESASGVESEEELVERVKKLESLKSKFQSADKKAHDIDEKSKGVCKTRTDAIKSGNIAKKKYNEAKDKHNALLDSKADEVKTLKAELEKLRKELDPRLFEEYQKLVGDNKFPPVVPATGDDKKALYNCGGCGLNLPQQGNALVKDKGWCHCDNCHRIIVKLQ